MWDFPHSSVGKESTCKAGDPSLIPGSGSSPGEGIDYPLQYSWASLVAQLVKNPLQCRRPGFNPWVGKIPQRRERLPTPLFWPGEFWSQRVGHNRATFTFTFHLPQHRVRICLLVCLFIEWHFLKTHCRTTNAIKNAYISNIFFICEKSAFK